MRTACFTGHRPDKLGGYSRNPKQDWVKAALRKVISWANGFDDVRHFISGGAIGVDQWAAEIVLSMGNEAVLTIAKPFPDQACMWPRSTQDHYQAICDMADSVVNVSEGPFTHAKMFKRNEWMVDRSDYVIAVWDGTPGGTQGTVKYARSQGKDVLRINPLTQTIEWERVGGDVQFANHKYWWQTEPRTRANIAVSPFTYPLTK